MFGHCSMVNIIVIFFLKSSNCNSIHRIFPRLSRVLCAKREVICMNCCVEAAYSSSERNCALENIHAYSCSFHPCFDTRHFRSCSFSISSSSSEGFRSNPNLPRKNMRSVWFCTNSSSDALGKLAKAALCRN
jgi:hypothetical protein